VLRSTQHNACCGQMSPDSFVADTHSRFLRHEIRQSLTRPKRKRLIEAARTSPDYFGSIIRSCKIIRGCAEGAADRDGKVRQWLESAQRGQIDGFFPLVLLSLPGFGAPGSAYYAAVGISGVRRMSPTVNTRSVIPRAMAGVRSRYLPFKPGTGSPKDSCGRTR
jgi:hypothetical protein